MTIIIMILTMMINNNFKFVALIKTRNKVSLQYMFATG